MILAIVVAQKILQAALETDDISAPAGLKASIDVEHAVESGHPDRDCRPDDG